MHAHFSWLFANGWSHVEHMFHFLLVLGGLGIPLVIVLALRPSTRRLALVIGLVILLVGLAVILDLWSRL